MTLIVLDPESDDGSGYESDGTQSSMPDMVAKDGSDEEEDEFACTKCSRIFGSHRALSAHGATCIFSAAAIGEVTVRSQSPSSASPLAAVTEAQYTQLSARTLSNLKAKAGVTAQTVDRFKSQADVLHSARMRQMVHELQEQLRLTGRMEPKSLLEKFKTLWPQMATSAQERRVIESVVETVQPIKRSLGVHKTKVKVGKNKFKHVEVEHFVIEFPLAEVLEAVLKHKGVITAVEAFRAEFRSHHSPDGVYRSFYDGDVYKYHRPLPHQFPDAYALVDYGDGVTFTDPCSNYKAHKLQMNYYALLELPPALQGLSELVLVSSICWTSTLKAAGPKAVFGGALEGAVDHLSFGSQLRRLRHGQLMQTADGPKIVRAYLHMHAADTPEANISAGKMETCTNTKHFCRLCMALQSQRLMPRGTVGFVSAEAGLGECGYCLRNPAEDAAQHAAVQGGAPGQPFGISNTLRGDTMFQDALDRSDFDPCRDVPTDGMHIGPEGVLATEFRRFFWWVAKATGLTGTVMDDLIHKFPYHASEKSDLFHALPANVFAGGSFHPAKKLKCTAAQCSVLARNIVQIFLPTMEVYDLLAAPQWLSLVSLCSAWRLLVQPVYTDKLLIELEKLIYEHHQ